MEEHEELRREYEELWRESDRLGEALESASKDETRHAMAVTYQAAFIRDLGGRAGERELAHLFALVGEWETANATRRSLINESLAAAVALGKASNRLHHYGRVAA